MKRLSKHIVYIFILMALPITSVYAEKDLNSLLKGTYAQNEQSACNSSFTPFQIGCPDCWTSQISAAGKITYNGDGTAHSEGRFGDTNTTNPGGDIGTYSCDWQYTVNSDRSFSYEGECTAQSLFSGEPPVTVTNQKWNGHIGKGKKTLLVNRYDAEIEGISVDSGLTNIIERICSKTGVQVKIRKPKEEE